MGIFKNIKNTIDFFIRNKMRFSRSGFHLENEQKDDIFDDFEDKERAYELEQKYFKKYNLESLKNYSTQYNYLENLYTIELLENYIQTISKKNNIDVLDIGSKNWAYANGQHNFFKYSYQNIPFSLIGIELDAFRVYTSLYSRYDSAVFNIKNLENTQYIAGDFLKHNKKYDYICSFLPFIVKEPLLYWGLPMNDFKPIRITQHSYDSLKSGGNLIVVNQGKEEYDTQHKIFEELGIPYEGKGIFKSTFLKYKNDRYVTVISK